jgi:hypothetical protein
MILVPVVALCKPERIGESGTARGPQHPESRRTFGRFR